MTADGVWARARARAIIFAYTHMIEPIDKEGLTRVLIVTPNATAPLILQPS